LSKRNTWQPWIKKHLRLQLLAPVELNVVCFRYNLGLADESELDRMNEEILTRIQESGVAGTIPCVQAFVELLAKFAPLENARA